MGAEQKAMEETFVPFEGIKNDLRGRLMCYKQDWTGGIRAGLRYYIYMLKLDYNVSRIQAMVVDN